MTLSPYDIFAALSGLLIVAVLVVVLVELPTIRRYLPAFLKYRHLLGTMVSRDFKVKYRRSVLGIFWSILQPLFVMLIVTFVFSNVFRVAIADYPVYYITGSFIFGLVSDSTGASLQSVIGGGSLIKKVYIPKYIFPLESCLFALISALFSFIAVIIVYIVQQYPFYPTFLLFFIPMLYATFFSFGLGLILSALVVYLRDIAHIWTIWLTAWFYVTPILYPLSILPDYVQSVLQFNPLVHYVDYAREIMMYGAVPGWQENLICAGFALVTLVVGLAVFKRLQDRFVLYI
ncbi:MAG: ABC transporter permease [Coriobacteriales bacterium]|jgi:ABC-2 type transport system permease protein|nr:ABC transporter permease [Coriobacteriales bacterium]